MSIRIPVPEGLVDLLRDFTVAVVKSAPADLEKFAAEYFIKLLAAMEAGQEASVTCTQTPSFLEFDENMYRGTAGAGNQDVDEELLQGSHLSAAVSHRSHMSAASVKSEQKPTCPDEAEKCWEKWQKAETDALEAAKQTGSTSNVSSAAPSTGKISATTGSRLMTNAPPAAGSTSNVLTAADAKVATGSATKISTSGDSAVVRQSPLRRDDDAQSAKSGASNRN